MKMLRLVPALIAAWLLAAPLVAHADVAPPPDLAGADLANPSPKPSTPPATMSSGCSYGGRTAVPLAAAAAVAAVALLARRRIA